MSLPERKTAPERGAKRYEKDFIDLSCNRNDTGGLRRFRRGTDEYAVKR